MTNWRALLSATSLVLLLLGTATLIEIGRPLPQSAALIATSIASTDDAFENLEIGAYAAYVYLPLSEKVLYAKNAEVPLALASLTKIMTAVTALARAPEGMEVTITQRSLMEEGDTGLLVDEQWKLTDLLSFSLVTSSNDGMFAVSNAVGISVSDNDGARTSFVALMNTKARELGLTQTYFTNETGLDTSVAQGGAYGSARDVAHLFYAAHSMYPTIFSLTAYTESVFTSESGISHKAKNTNEAAETIPGLLASKTGFTDISGGNLAIIVDLGIGKPVAIAVLGSTREGRFEDALKLLGAARIAILNNPSL